MRLITPDYYEEFKCIAGDCPESCCIGWELDIDPDTLAYYKTVTGPLGKRLAACIEKGVVDETASFHLAVNGRCPFLGEDGLCDIVKELGPEALSEVCSEYPRYSFSYGDVVEKSLTLSCPEVARMLFTSTAPVWFKEYDIGPGDDEEEDAEYCFTAIEDVRKTMIDLLEDRTLPISERLSRMLVMADYVQGIINEGAAPDEMTASLKEALTLKTFYPLSESAPLSKKRSLAFLRERLEILASLEVLCDEWTEVLSAMSTPEAEDALTGDNLWKQAEELCGAIVWEHLLTYLVFRYFPHAAYDYDVMGKTQYVIFCAMTIRDMVLSGAQSDFIRAVRLFSREVEHSEENMDILMEEALFADSLHTNSLARTFR